jgi:Mg2+ and Co2+ transporter CorA
MLTAYPAVRESRLQLDASKGTWIDLLNPTKEEVTRVESAFHLKLPSRESLREIESSSRLTEKDGILFLSMPVVANAHDLDEDPSPLGLFCLRCFSSLSATRDCGHLRLSPQSCPARIHAQASRHFVRW